LKVDEAIIFKEMKMKVIPDAKGNTVQVLKKVDEY